MALRDVLVRITGKEDVSKEAAKAGGALKSLGAQAKSLLGSQLFQVASFAGIVAGLRKSYEAANELEASTRKLEGTSKITGVALETLQEISRRGQDAFKLNATVANDFSVELVKLASKAGDVGKASAGLDAFLNLGAAKGLTAAQTLTAVQQSILGIDEGTDKLFNKNPSVLYQEYAAAIGTTAGKLTDQQKAQALLNAAITDGGKVGGSYADYLQSAAGQQEQLTTQLKASAAELGRALSPALLAILPVLTSLAKMLTTVIQQLQIFGVNIAYHFEQIPVVVARVKGETLGLLGRMVQEASNFIPFFGDKVAALGTELVKEGRRQVSAAESTSRDLLAAKKDTEEKILGVVRSSGMAQVASATTTGAAVTKVTADEAKKRKEDAEKDAEDARKAHEKWNKETLAQLQTLGQWLGKERDKQVSEAKDSAELLATQLQVNLGKAAADALTLTTDAMEKLLNSLKGKIPIEQWQALNAELQRHKSSLADMLPPTEELAESAKRAADENKRISEEQAKQEKSTENNARKAADLARAFIDAASATGLIDQKMASILNSAISLAANIGKAFGGDPTAIAASVTSLANIIVGLGTSETERKRQAAYAQNTLALDKLTREVGNLNLRESGKTFAGIQNAVDASIQARADARAAGKGPGEADKAAKDAFLKSLQSQGIGLEEARALFKDLFGRDLALANAGTFFQDIQAFAEGLKNTEFGQFGSDFASQLDAVIKGFDILNVSDADNKLQEFRDLVGKFSPALSKALDEDLSSPEGRAKAAANLQALFQKLKSGGLSPEEIGVSGNEFLSLIGTILPLLAEANGTLANGLPTTGPQTIGTTGGGNPLGAPGLPTSTFGIGAPSITGSVVPTPNTTTINGGIHPTVIVQAREGETDDAFVKRIADAVDQLMGMRYDSLIAGSGSITQVGAS